MRGSVRYGSVRRRRRRARARGETPTQRLGDHHMDLPRLTHSLYDPYISPRAPAYTRSTCTFATHPRHRPHRFTHSPRYPVSLLEPAHSQVELGDSTCSMSRPNL